MDDKIETSAEMAEAAALPRGRAVHADPSAGTTPEQEPLPEGVQKKPVEQKSPAEWAYERLILESLHTSSVEGIFTPKEQRVVDAYVTLMEEADFTYPTATELAERLGNVDRTGVHGPTVPGPRVHAAVERAAVERALVWPRL